MTTEKSMCYVFKDGESVVAIAIQDSRVKLPVIFRTQVMHLEDMGEFLKSYGQSIFQPVEKPVPYSGADSEDPE